VLVILSNNLQASYHICDALVRQFVYTEHCYICNKSITIQFFVTQNRTTPYESLITFTLR